MGRRRDGAVVTVVAVTAFVTMLDNTIVTVAAPSIRADLGVGVTAVQWVSVGYMLTFAGLLITGGRLADAYGRRRVLLGGLSLFTLGSAGAGLAATAGPLIAFRAVQGAGAALAMPATLAMLAGCTPPVRQRGVAVWMVAGGAALALGPVLGGALSEHAGWRAVFLLQVPVGLAAAALTRRTVPESRDPGRPPVDVAGLGTSAVALAAAAYLVLGSPGGGGPGRTVAALLAGGAAMAFVAVQRRAPHPMVDLRLFRDPRFAGGTAVQVLWGLGVTGVCFFTSLRLQDTMGLTPTGAGLCFLPLAVLLAAVAPAAAPLAGRFGAGPVVAAGLSAVAAGMVLAAAGGPRLEVLLAAMAVIGAGSALTVPLADGVLAAMPAAAAGTASGVFSTAREISGAVGIAVVGLVVGGPTADAGRGYAGGLWLAGALALTGAALSVLVLPGPIRSERVVRAAVTEPLGDRPQPQPQQRLDAHVAQEPRRLTQRPEPVVSGGHVHPEAGQ